jgi:hypothetical protein
VEKPFRNKQKFKRKQIFIASLVGSFIIFAIGVLFITGNDVIGHS